MQKKWVNTFLEEGTKNGCGDLSIMVKTVSEIREAAREHEASLWRERVKSVLPKVRGSLVFEGKLDPDDVDDYLEPFIMTILNN